MLYELGTFFYIIGLIYVYALLLAHYGSLVLRYFMNEHLNWNAAIEKPRILVHIIGLIIMHLLFFQFHKTTSTLLLILQTSAFIGAVIFCQISWRPVFIKQFESHKKKQKASKKTSFDLQMSDDEIRLVYNGLVRYHLINIEKTSFTDFKNVLTTSWDEHQSSIYFELDAPSCREFYDFLNRRFPKNSLSLKAFFNYSKCIKRPDGALYNYNTIKTATWRTPISKKHKELTQIFKNLE